MECPFLDVYTCAEGPVGCSLLSDEPQPRWGSKKSPFIPQGRTRLPYLIISAKLDIYLDPFSLLSMIKTVEKVTES